MKPWLASPHQSEDCNLQLKQAGRCLFKRWKWESCMLHCNDVLFLIVLKVVFSDIRKSVIIWNCPGYHPPNERQSVQRWKQSDGMTKGLWSNGRFLVSTCMDRFTPSNLSAHTKRKAPCVHMHGLVCPS